jgi:hypothetical protein
VAVIVVAFVNAMYAIRACGYVVLPCAVEDPLSVIMDFAVDTEVMVSVLDVDPFEMPIVPLWIDLMTLAVREASGVCDHTCDGLSCLLIR